MALITVPIGEWLPDQPDYRNAGAITATNVMPWSGGAYKSFPALTAQSNALAARCQGAYFTRGTDGTTYNFAGTATKLHQLTSGNSYSDVSRLAGGAYTIATDYQWEFTQWSNTVIAVNGADAPQVITLGGANFAALAGSPPTGAHIAIVKDFVVQGNIVSNTSRVAWSAINNSADWTIAAATQCDVQDLPGDGGWVQKVVGGEYGLVFQDHAIWKMTYSGSPEIFQFDKIETKRGCAAPDSVINYGSLVFYLADDGFYVTGGGGASVGIGEGKVDKTFLNDLDSSYYYRITSAIDPVNKIVAWGYPGSGHASGGPNFIMLYHWPSKKWARVSTTIEIFARFASLGYTLDGLDAVSSSIDALTDSLDSRVWAGGRESLAAFNTSHKLGTFTGTAMDATVDTIEMEHFAGRRAHITGVRPLVDGNAASVAVGTRTRLADTASFASAVGQQSDGLVPVRSHARYHRYRITTTGAFNFIQGALVDAQPGDFR